MTASPLLPPGVAGPTAETEATDAELSRMTELALSRGARAIAIGSGRSLPATRAATGFARRFQAAGGSVICTVTWPESAASWLRQATRFAGADPDLWVMAGPATGWAQMTRRLLWSTTWRPERTIAFAAIGNRHVTGLVDAHNLPGLSGATVDGGTWQISHGIVRVIPPSLEDPQPRQRLSASIRAVTGHLIRSLPCLVAIGAAAGAGTVASGDGGHLVGEEDPVTRVSAAGDRAQRRRAVETAVDPGTPVAAPLPFHVRPVRSAVGA
jgi:hypothetical protein